MSKKSIVLKKLKELDTIWHPESQLVFRSAKEKIVIGKYVDEEFIDLDDDCVSLCHKYGFKYDETLLQEKVSEQDPEPEENEPEPEEEQEHEESEETEQDHNEEQDTSPVSGNNTEPEIVPNEELKSDTLYVADDFSNTLSSVNDILNTFVASLIKSHTAEVEKLKQELDDLKVKYYQESKAHELTQSDLEKLKTKFEGIKQLFSL